MKQIKYLFILLIVTTSLSFLRSQTNIIYDPFGVITYAEFNQDSTSGYSDSDFFYKILNLSDYNNFVAFNKHGTDSDEFFYKEFLQYYKEIPVENSKLTLHYKNGIIFRLSGNYLPIKEDVNLSINIDTNYVKQIYFDHFQIEENVSYLFIIDTVLLRDTSNIYSATLCIKISLLDSILDQNTLYVNAINGDIVKETHHGVLYDVCPTTQNTYYSGTQSAAIDCRANGDPRYQSKVWDKRIMVVNSGDDINFRGNYYEDQDNIWGNTTNFQIHIDNEYPKYITDAFWGAQVFVDYFKNTFDYLEKYYIPQDSAQGVNGPEINDGYNPIAFTTLPNLNNMSLWSQCTTAHGMHCTLRNNIVIVGFQTGNNKPHASLDLISHEFSHSFADVAGDLEYTVESDEIIMEGCADIWAAVIDASVPELNKNIWQIGDEVMTTTGTCIRDLADPDNPDAETQIIDCYSEFLASEESDPHVKGGLISHWFYLLSEGRRNKL